MLLLFLLFINFRGKLNACMHKSLFVGITVLFVHDSVRAHTVLVLDCLVLRCHLSIFLTILGKVCDTFKRYLKMIHQSPPFCIRRII